MVSLLALGRVSMFCSSKTKKTPNFIREDGAYYRILLICIHGLFSGSLHLSKERKLIKVGLQCTIIS